MQIFIKPTENEWDELLKRPSADAIVLEKSVRKILQQVKQKGDTAVRKYTHQFDGVKLRKASVTEKEIRSAASLLPDEVKKAIIVAAKEYSPFP